MRQVIHALLTRPPLSQLKIIRRINSAASLDLHVLSTPPAFILSQDQTLMLKVDRSSDYLAWLIYPKPSLLGFCSEFSQIQRSKPDLLFSEFSGFYILFNLQLSRFFVVVSFSTARLFYHSCLSLSTTFFILFFVAHQQLNHLIMYHCFCQQLFYFSQILFYLSHCFRNGTII